MTRMSFGRGLCVLPDRSAGQRRPFTNWMHLDPLRWIKNGTIRAMGMTGPSLADTNYRYGTGWGAPRSQEPSGCRQA